MSKILKLTVTSDPAAIELTLEWTGTDTLDASDVHVDKSHVTIAGDQKKLDGWSVQGTPTADASGPYTIVLERDAAATSEYEPQPDENVALEMHVAGESKPLLAAAVVDAGERDCECEQLIAEAVDKATDVVDDVGGRLETQVKSVSSAVQDVNTAVGQTATAVDGFKTSADESLTFLTGFPFQVLDGMSGGAPTTAAGAAGANAVIDAQLKAILGRSPGRGGVTATLAALDRSFQPVVVDGARTWAWHPQSYAVQSDVGSGVTGRQASIATFSVSVADDITPLIDGLTPLVPENVVNPDEIDAARAIVQDSLPAFVTELGADGGPRIPRAQGLLTDVATNLLALGMLLGAFGKQPGDVDLSNPDTWDQSASPQYHGKPVKPLDPSSWPPVDEFFVVTVDDEQNLTNYRIAFDRSALLIGQFQDVYAGGPQLPRDRGLLLVLLQEALDAVGETAQGVIDALDSVNFGTDERQVTFVPNLSGATVEDVLSWAAAFPVDEAGPLLQDSGKLGARSIVARLGQPTQPAVGSTPAQPGTGLSDAVAQLATMKDPINVRHPRVQAALGLLTDALNKASAAATQLT